MPTSKIRSRWRIQGSEVSVLRNFGACRNLQLCAPEFPASARRAAAERYSRRPFPIRPPQRCAQTLPGLAPIPQRIAVPRRPHRRAPANPVPPKSRGPVPCIRCAGSASGDIGCFSVASISIVESTVCGPRFRARDRRNGKVRCARLRLDWRDKPATTAPHRYSQGRCLR